MLATARIAFLGAHVALTDHRSVVVIATLERHNDVYVNTYSKPQDIAVALCAQHHLLLDRDRS